MNRSVLVLFLLVHWSFWAVPRPHRRPRSKSHRRRQSSPSPQRKARTLGARLTESLWPRLPLPRKLPLRRMYVKEPVAKVAAPAVSAAEVAASEDNPLLREFLTKGIEMPDGTLMKLSPPILSGRMTPPPESGNREDHAAQLPVSRILRPRIRTHRCT